ncbi:MAG: hypothetical protein AABY00_00210 [Nanoarchaeota archaeon]
MSNSPQHYASLNSFFANTAKPLGFSPQERRTAAEKKFLESVLSGTGTQYTYEDIVAVAFGTTHELEGNRIHQILLTDRGLQELSIDRKLSSKYEVLFKRLGCQQSSVPLYQQVMNGAITKHTCMVGHENAPEFIDITHDDQRRVMIIYSCDVTHPEEVVRSKS